MLQKVSARRIGFTIISSGDAEKRQIHPGTCDRSVLRER